MLVEIFDEGGVAAGNRRGRLELLEKVRAHSRTIETKKARQCAPRQHAKPACRAAG
jgi:hypothetical protein